MLSIDLVGRRAIVTGVTSGIGVSIVKALQDAGAFVIGVGRRSLPTGVAPDEFDQGDATEPEVRSRALDLLGVDE